MNTKAKIKYILPVGLALLGCALFWLSFRPADADSVNIKNPYWVGNTTVTSNWNHPTLAPTPYFERAIDAVTDSNAEGESIYLNAENIDGYYHVYYDVLNYGTSCTGLTLDFYKHPPGGDPSTYVLLGKANFVHIEDSPSWTSYDIVPSDSDGRWIGYVKETECGSSGPHLHHGRNTWGTVLNENTSITTGTGMSSEALTLYK